MITDYVRDAFLLNYKRRKPIHPLQGWMESLILIRK